MYLIWTCFPYSGTSGELRGGGQQCAFNLIDGTVNQALERLDGRIEQIEDCIGIWNGFGIVDVRNLSDVETILISGMKPSI